MSAPRPPHRSGRVESPSANSNGHSGRIPSPRPRSDERLPTGHDVDTVHFRRLGSYDPGPYRSLDAYEEFRGETGAWLYSQARYKNVRLKFTPSTLWGRGSLAVLAMGSNAAPFDHGRLAHALEGLADVLGLPLSELLEADVRRLDFGANVPLDRPVGEVTRAVVQPPRRRLVVHGPSSAAIVTRRHQLAVYDKRAEQRARRDGYVSADYGEGPLARVERRLLSDVDAQLGQPVSLGTLLDPDFFSALGQRLVAEVEAVPFEPAVAWKMCRRVSELQGWLAGHGIARVGGLGAVLDAIHASKEAGVATADQARALRRKAYEIAERNKALAPTDIGAEFASALRAAVGL